MATPNGSDTLLGSAVAGYRIEALIGRGGMGAVYRAEEAELSRKVALKVIAPELAQDSRFRERFLRESQLAASLDHPHVVPIYRAGEAEGQLYLAMRYVEGTDLARLLADHGALGPARAVELVSQVAEALDAAHAKGLVHRDVKPSNVLIAEAAGKEHCYLADFGLTKRTGSLSGVTAPGDVVGTLEYVAPEQITGDALDERSDVYSLGCVLYECVTGQTPFPRATDVALLWAHVHEEPEPPSKLRPELPRELDTVLARALAKEPGRRYRQAGELAAAARSALGLAEGAPAAKRLSRRLIAGAALALGAIAVALVLLLRSGDGGLSSVLPNHVGVIDAKTNKLIGQAQVGIRPDAVSVGEGAVWVANLDDQTLTRIDPESRTVQATVSLNSIPHDVTAAAGAVWVASGVGGVPRAMMYVSPQDNTEIGTISTSDGVEGSGLGLNSVSFGARAVWAAFDYTSPSGPDTLLRRVDPAAHRIVDETHLAAWASDIALGSAGVWITDREGGAVLHVSPNNLETRETITVGPLPSSIAVGAGAIWVSTFEDDGVRRLETAWPNGRTTAGERIAVGDGPIDIAVGEGAIWVANSLDGTVSRIDPDSSRVVETIDVGGSPQGIAVGEGAVWVTVQPAAAPEAP